VNKYFIAQKSVSCDSMKHVTTVLVFICIASTRLVKLHKLLQVCPIHVMDASF